jgi:small ligand-binding sensory domain FIST
MRWASAASDAASLDRAVAMAAEEVARALDGDEPDLMVAFLSSHHAAEADRLPRLLASRLGGGTLLGCSAGGVIGGGVELERRPGFSLAAARLPGVGRRPFHVEAGSIHRLGAGGARDPLTGRAAPPSSAGAPVNARTTEPAPDPPRCFVVLADPFTLDGQALARRLDEIAPGATVIGGLASGGRGPSDHALYLDGDVVRTGAVGVALSGPLRVDALVAQGCRPVGRPMFVTACEENLLLELNGRKPADVLRELDASLDERDRQLARGALFFGIVMSEKRDEYRQGDFLVRNLMGRDPATGGLWVGAPLRRLDVVQFHLRDARTSAEELDALLSRYRDSSPPPAGALLFSCLGRGVGLYGTPDHDSRLFRSRLGDVPLGGFFCNGEIGPVQGTTFLHGYTSSFGLFHAT